MKRLALVILVLITIIMPAVSAAGDNIIISQVLYDPLGTETGGEAVELYNPSAGPMDIGGYVLMTESSSTDATVPVGTILAAKTFYLISDSGWSTLRDELIWPEADYEEAITMSNIDAGVALVHPNGTILDAVGWGDSAGIDIELLEGTPAALVVAGNSLIRADLNSDTDNNSADFSESAPDVHNSSTTTCGSDNSSHEIVIGVEIENNAPTLSSVIVLYDEDILLSGVQISPVPEGTKTIMLSADVTDIDGTEPEVIATVTGPESQWSFAMIKTADLNGTAWRYNTTLDLQFYDGAGMYHVQVFANDGSANSTMNSTFEYLSMTAISIDASALEFTGAILGRSAEITGDFALSTTDAPTVRNIGNTQIDIGLYGTNLVDGTKSIGLDNIKYSFDNDFGSTLSGTLGTAIQTQNLGLANAADSAISLGFQLFVPSTTQNGNYTGSVTIVAVSS